MPILFIYSLQKKEVRMADQRIVDYAKSALSENVSIAQIKENLVSKGWSEFDVNQALDAATQERIFPKAPKHSRSVMLAIFLIVIISAGAFGFYIVNKKDTGSSIEAAPTFNLIKECLENFDCFIQESKSCKTSKLKYTTQPIDIRGVLQTTTNFYEIKGLENGKCVLYIQTLKIDLKFSDNLTRQMSASGNTQEQITQQEQTSNQEADKLEGLDGTCKFNTNDLTALLNKWKIGTFSTDDFKVAECSGKMFQRQPK